MRATQYRIWQYEDLPLFSESPIPAPVLTVAPEPEPAADDNQLSLHVCTLCWDTVGIIHSDLGSLCPRCLEYALRQLGMIVDPPAQTQEQ